MLSVILPASNEEAYIGACLTALLASAPVPGGAEVVVVANGCRDATAARAQAMQDQAKAAGWTLTVLDLDPDGPAPVLFIEQNDPLRLTAEAYAADSDHSGLDQVDRLAIWARMGAEVAAGDLRRGDLVFWKGHVAIMEDETTMIHANGNTMSVARETLAAAIERIGWLYGEPTGYRRPVAET